MLAGVSVFGEGGLQLLLLLLFDNAIAMIDFLHTGARLVNKITIPFNH
jgi:hypothetical protein